MYKWSVNYQLGVPIAPKKFQTLLKSSSMQKLNAHDFQIFPMSVNRNSSKAAMMLDSCYLPISVNV